ncbi:hypothetical protein DNTS_011696 [Danionella cerebrum]|uniref:Uncharacterized protein n=1 Tax=Danionella cerebrum TaxID=2873325 RepID=A0A553QUN9_9TELE|nr:hypothetical protein DNTS_011696 [Danionella translucida]
MVEARLVGEFRVASSHREHGSEIHCCCYPASSTSNQLPFHLTPPQHIEDVETRRGGAIKGTLQRKQNGPMHNTLLSFDLRTTEGNHEDEQQLSRRRWRRERRKQG